MVFVHAEFGGAMFHEHVEFLEGVCIEQQFDALPRRQLAAGVLGRDTAFAAAGAGLGALGSSFSRISCMVLPGVQGGGPPC